MKKTFSWFRKIALAEGISFIILLFIAMPLKYFGDKPKAVSICGGIHGCLFISFIILALLVKEQYNKNFNWFAKAFLVSIVPFGTLLMDKYWAKEEEVAKS